MQVRYNGDFYTRVHTNVVGIVAIKKLAAHLQAEKNKVGTRTFYTCMRACVRACVRAPSAGNYFDGIGSDEHNGCVSRSQSTGN